MITASHIDTDQNWQDETTVYWFELRGHDDGTGQSFNGEIYGVSECQGESTIVDCDGCPMTDGDGETIAVRKACVVHEPS